MDGIAVRTFRRAPFISAYVLLLMAGIALAPITAVANGGCGTDGGMPQCQGGNEPTSKAMSGSAHRHVGNPIDVVSGNKYQQVSDYKALGSPLVFVRHYNSLSTGTNTAMGQGWRHTWQVTLTRLGTDRLEVVQGDGRAVEFARSGHTSANGRAQFSALNEGDGLIELDEQASLATWIIDDERRLSFRGSFLVRVDFASGTYLELKYRGNRVFQVRDSIGNMIELRYTPGEMALPRFGDARSTVQPGHLESVRLPGGLIVKYRYDGRRNLIGVSYGDAWYERYGYSDSAHGSHLTERVDTRGRVSSWSYDSQGRATRYANSHRSLSVNYAPVDQRSGTSTVTHDNYIQERSTWRREAIGDHAEIVLVEYRTCNDCTWGEIWPVRRVDWRGKPLSPEELYPTRPGASVSGATAANPSRAHSNIPALSAERAADEAAFESYAQSLRDRLVPVPDSFAWASADDLPPSSASGSDSSSASSRKTIELSVDNQGNAVDLRIGELSLKELRERAARGQLAECSATGKQADLWMDEHLRSLDTLRPEQACLKELLLLESLRHGLEVQLAVSEKRRPPVSAQICSDVRTCEQLAHALRMAELSRCVYESTWNCHQIARPIDPASIGIDQSLFVNENTGFHAQLVQMHETGEYVLVFRGTDTATLEAFIRDGATDIRQFLARNDPQYQNARELAILVEVMLQHHLDVDSFHITGHSLGGGLATQAALATGQQASVFNAAALRPGVAEANHTYLADVEHLVSSYIVDEEILDVIQAAGWEQTSTRGETEWVPCDLCGHSAPGQRIDLPVPASMPYGSWLSPAESAALHSSNAVVDSLRDVLLESCNIAMKAPA